MKQRTVILLIGVIALLNPTLAQGRLISERFRQLTRTAEWQLIASQPVNFNTHHPQGMVKIGEVFYVSSVEVTTPTKRFAMPQNGFDRDTGAGFGHLFKFDGKGDLIADLKLGDGTMYHLGGIDFDGKFIWVSVAEYRPNSHSIIYRVDPVTMTATEVFRFADHLGGIVHNLDKHTLHAVSWGSRWFYRWTLDAKGRVRNANIPPTKLRQRNPSFYVDYQDCKYLGRGEMLCGGLSNYQRGSTKFSLGGLELIDLTSGRARHQLPLELWTESGLPMTQNPFWIEATMRGLRTYFLPEDQRSTMYVFEVKTN
jgi:Family of unknown function (DUF6454)